MWQHCFNSSVFWRWQPHPKTLWGCPWWQESDTCKTGLSHALICAKAWKCFNCFLSGDALLSLKERRELRGRRRDLGSNLFLTAALMWWCWNQNIVTMIYANYAWNICPTVGKLFEDNFCGFLAVCDDPVVLRCHYTTHIEIQKRALKYC